MKAESLSTTSGQAMEGPLLITPDVYGDERGFFFESWNERRWSQLLSAHGQEAQPFVQDNHSRSSQGVLRGLHWQIPPHPQAKLVRCVAGEIFDVAVDLRRSSPRFGHWVGAHLCASNNKQLWVPVGFAHGFLALSEHAEVLYKATDFWSQDCERSLNWGDPTIAIDWPFSTTGPDEAKLSKKDAGAPILAEIMLSDVFA
jgi:dTDP-4-dehydrorhamnose 3,5-epimerase